MLFLLQGVVLAQTPQPQRAQPGQGFQPPTGIATRRVAAGLSAPIAATHAPGDSTRLFIAEQVEARIRILDLTSGILLPLPFLDIDSRVIDAGNEQGLLGLAFHPAYPTNGLFYVNYTRTGDGATVIAEYEVTSDPDVASFDSERILLTIDQPQQNHNGGWIGFGPLDGYLYIATGDGGGGCDFDVGHTPNIGNAQDLTNNNLGKILRIDPLGGVPYGIPPDNPFVGVIGGDEIWSYGLRNPWRASFDRLTGDLYIGDVGERQREEVDFQSGLSSGGVNYGWRCMEGNTCSTNAPSSCPVTPGCRCPAPTPGITAPIHDYNHQAPPPPTNIACAVVGGYVYRGSDLPEIQGHYFFADFCGNGIWSFRVEGGAMLDFRDRTSALSPSLDGFGVTLISSFGEDADGELYIVDLGGEVFKVVAAL